jgi:cytochrome c oxidase cbb3-type subunit 3
MTIQPTAPNNQHQPFKNPEIVQVMKYTLFRKLTLILPLLLLGTLAIAQEAGGESASNFYDKFLGNGLLILAALVVLFAIATLYSLLSSMIKIQQLRIYEEQGLEAFLEEAKAPKEPFWKKMYSRLTDNVPIEKEKDILFDHEFDGIRELDNSLPPWWVAMFYITIAFGVVYYTYYHFLGYGPNQAEQYEMEMEKAEEEIAAYLASQANLVDETNVEMVADEGEIALGNTLYQTKCAACHGALGEGGVGPNLTDPYWIHGGSIKDVFKTIKYGVPEKGMISWKNELRPPEMAKVASFIMTLQGTNPPNAKEPQGELFQAEKVEPAQDSTANSNSEVIGMN